MIRNAKVTELSLLSNYIICEKMLWELRLVFSPVTLWVEMIFPQINYLWAQLQSNHQRSSNFGVLYLILVDTHRYSPRCGGWSFRQ